jgi:ABC-type Co2+ transport system permease subunit
MSATNTLETGLLTLLFINTALANIGDAGGLQPSASAGSFDISVHTGDPGEAGVQTTNEADYTSYARVTVARGAAQWTVTDDTADNDNAITFPEASGGSNTLTFFAIGSVTSVDLAFITGALTASLAVSSGITPEFAAGALDVQLG